MVYGLIVLMYYLDTKQHNLPHTHVKFGEFEVPGGNLIESNLPLNKEKMVKAWIKIHKEDLMANWQLA